MGAHSILDKHTFRDASTPESQVQSSFIRVYSEYLSERLFLFRCVSKMDTKRLAPRGTVSPLRCAAGRERSGTRRGLIYCRPLLVFRALELDLFIDTAQRNTTVFKEMPVNEVLAKLPQAQTALNKLVACVPEAQARSR